MAIISPFEKKTELSPCLEESGNRVLKRENDKEREREGREGE